MDVALINYLRRDEFGDVFFENDHFYLKLSIVTADDNFIYCLCSIYFWNGVELRLLTLFVKF